jgi:RimJ/RimL family protein N-acetyltransferase
MEKSNVKIRWATEDDAKGVSDVIAAIVDEDEYTVMRRFDEPEEKEYIQKLSPREKIFVAEVDGRIIGVQTLSLEHGYSDKMAHVATMGTWIIDGYRRIGVGKLLAGESLGFNKDIPGFARDNKYEKIVIEVLADNEPALIYYSKLGFKRAGLLRRQVKLHGEYKDQVVMELFL